MVDSRVGSCGPRQQTLVNITTIPVNSILSEGGEEADRNKKRGGYIVERGNTHSAEKW